jgi:hypothetical protein
MQSLCLQCQFALYLADAPASFGARVPPAPMYRQLINPGILRADHMLMGGGGG